MRLISDDENLQIESNNDLNVRSGIISIYYRFNARLTDYRIRIDVQGLRNLIYRFDECLTMKKNSTLGDNAGREQAVVATCIRNGSRTAVN